MILKNCDYIQLVNKIKIEKKKVIVYGYGMIGQVIIPYLIKKYDIFNYIECFVDMDPRKKGKYVNIEGHLYEIKDPRYLCNKRGDLILLITNSNFASLIDWLDSIQELDHVESYIIPIMQSGLSESIDCFDILKDSHSIIIPKKIHYCWFGKKEMPDFLKMCISSWEKYCSDYEIIQWNEENYDINKFSFVRQAYEYKKYGFMSDMVRLDILYENGGIYFDTDVTITRNLDDLLYQKGFIGVEKWGNINSGGGCGFIQRHPMVKELLEYRKKFVFVREDGTLNLETNGIYETIPFLKYGFRPDQTLQKIKDVTIYPSFVFHPYDYVSCEMQETKSNFAIHHFYGSWMDENAKITREKTKNICSEILYRMTDDEQQF